jgi:hypothetical protein
MLPNHSFLMINFFSTPLLPAAQQRNTGSKNCAFCLPPLESAQPHTHVQRIACRFENFLSIYRLGVKNFDFPVCMHLPTMDSLPCRCQEVSTSIIRLGDSCFKTRYSLHSPFYFCDKCTFEREQLRAQQSLAPIAPILPFTDFLCPYFQRTLPVGF